METEPIVRLPLLSSPHSSEGELTGLPSVILNPPGGESEADTDKSTNTCHGVTHTSRLSLCHRWWKCLDNLSPSQMLPGARVGQKVSVAASQPCDTFGLPAATITRVKCCIGVALELIESCVLKSSGDVFDFLFRSSR